MLQILRLRNAIRHYPWGSRRVIAELQGRAVPSARPEAELWIGAHPGDPSQVLVEGRWQSLEALLDRHGPELLGPGIGPGLPFLLKVLAAAEPLSIQAHPDGERARAGFAAEQAAGLPLSAANRNYRDPYPKPEVLLALTPFRMLRGFRAPEQILAYLHGTQLSTAVPAAAALQQSDPARALRDFVAELLRWPGEEVQQCLAAATPHLQRLSVSPRQSSEAEGQMASLAGTVLDLSQRYPGDPGAFGPLFLHLLELQPGEAVFTGAGVLHAYLEGAGIELMASSDNVLRGGLTSKYVDVPGLLSILHFAPQQPHRLEPQPAAHGGLSYRAPEDLLCIDQLRLHPDEALELATAQQPALLLCTEGEGRLEVPGAGHETAHRFTAGEAFFLPASLQGCALRGAAELYLASAPGLA